jgi:hypothetical protein
MSQRTMGAQQWWVFNGNFNSKCMSFISPVRHSGSIKNLSVDCNLLPLKDWVLPFQSTTGFAEHFLFTFVRMVKGRPLQSENIINHSNETKKGI